MLAFRCVLVTAHRCETVTSPSFRLQITVTGLDVPRPICSFEQTSFPNYVLAQVEWGVGGCGVVK